MYPNGSGVARLVPGGRMPQTPLDTSVQMNSMPILSTSCLWHPGYTLLNGRQVVYLLYVLAHGKHVQASTSILENYYIFTDLVEGGLCEARAHDDIILIMVMSSCTLV